MNTALFSFLIRVIFEMEPNPHLEAQEKYNLHNRIRLSQL